MVGARLGPAIEGIGKEEKTEVSRQEVVAEVEGEAAVLMGIALPVHVGTPQT